MDQLLTGSKVKELLCDRRNPAVRVEHLLPDLRQRRAASSLILQDSRSCDQKHNQTCVRTFQPGTSFMITASSSRFSRSIRNVLQEKHHSSHAPCLPLVSLSLSPAPNCDWSRQTMTSSRSLGLIDEARIINMNMIPPHIQIMSQ